MILLHVWVHVIRCCLGLFASWPRAGEAAQATEGRAVCRMESESVDGVVSRGLH